MTETTRQLAHIVEQVIRVLHVALEVEDVDHRRELVDAAGELLATARKFVDVHRVPGDGSARLLMLLRRVVEEQEAQARAVEARLRERAAWPPAPARDGG